MITKQLSEYLRGSQFVRDRVGPRVYPSRVPGGVAGECLVLRDISTRPEYSLDGEVGIHDATIQIDAYADQPYKAKSLAELVRNRLSGYRGEIGTIDPVEIQSTRIIRQGALPEDPKDGGDKWVHRYSTDYEFWYYASVPDFT